MKCFLASRTEEDEMEFEDSDDEFDDVIYGEGKEEKEKINDN